DAHQGVEAEGGEGLVTPYRVRLYAKNRADNFTDCLRDHRFLLLRTRRFDPVAPIGGAAVSLAIFDRREDALEKRIPLHASEKCFPFGPVNPDSGELSVAGGERRLEDGDHFTGR